MKQKLKVVALVLAIALIFSGCSMITKNDSRVETQVVATVNGTPVYRYQVETYYKLIYYLYYGAPANISATDDTTKAMIKSMVEAFSKDQVLLQKAKELNLTLTDSDKAANQSNADYMIYSIKSGIQTDVENAAKADPTINVDTEVNNRYQTKLTDMGFTSEDYVGYLNDQTLISKVQDYTKQFAQVTDDDVTKWYNDTLAQQQKDMDANPSVFATDVNANQIVTYVPEDTVAVKQVLLSCPDTNLEAVAKQLYSDGDTNEATTVLQPEIDALMPKAQDIVHQLNNGASINNMIDQYGEDPGMKAGGTNAANGYIVGNSTKDYMQAFKDAALKLTKVGDTSEPVITVYGIHILQNIKSYTKGVISLDTLKDQIKTAMLPNKQSDKFTEMRDQWIKAAKITYDENKMFN